jgi:hypothetical protein
MTRVAATVACSFCKKKIETQGIFIFEGTKERNTTRVLSVLVAEPIEKTVS